MEKMNGKSLDIVQDNVQYIKQKFPDVFTEGKIDFDKLRLVLGDNIEENDERYQFTWNGKSEAIKNAQTPSMGTLRPDKESSKNWDITENLYIEGDNLEVLKLLQKSYFGKVKMIYIDPPYNTGKDFVYKDNFRASIANYKEITNQTTKANTETSGRYHTDWLNMMYPRLKLARNLLREDGVIFISISDMEMDNIKKLCNEVFGEDNFIANLIWDRNHSAQAGIFKVYHEYVLVYCKNIENISTPKARDKELFEAGAIKKESNRHSKQSFTFPKATRFDAEDGTVITGSLEGIESIEIVDGVLICENGKLKEDVTIKAAYTQINQMKEYFYGDREKLVDSRGQKIVEFYLNSNGKVKVVKERGVITPPTTLKLGAQGPISLKLAELFNLQDSPIDAPKPVNMILNFLEWFIEDNDIIIDFFSGSGTTAEATIKFNEKYNAKVKFILVQIPELIDNSKESYREGYRNICEIGKERIRRAGDKVVSESGKTDLDIGFKVFKLDDSNIKEWNPNYDELEFTLDEMTDNLKLGRTKEDLLYEILIKMGIELTAHIEEINVGDKTIYNIGIGSLVLCLEDEITEEIIKEIPKYKSDFVEMKVVFKETGFRTDSQKMNAMQNLKQFGINDVRSI